MAIQQRRQSDKRENEDAESRVARLNLRLPPRRVGEEGYSYSEQVENKQGTSEEAHTPGVGQRANHARDDEDQDDAVFEVAEEKSGIHDTEERQKEHEDREFKGNAEAKNDCQEEAGIVLDGKNRMEAMADSRAPIP